MNRAERVKTWSTMALVGLLAAACAAAGVPVRSSIFAQITGDEPEYLLTAISLAEDFSLDISDEIADERYRDFHEVRLEPQARVMADGRMVSPHDPFLPALLGPAVVLAQAAGIGAVFLAKLTVSLMAGTLAALLTWTAVRRLDVGLFPAAVTVGVLAASAPIAIYGSQLYPEIPAALALTVTVVALTGPLGSRGLAGMIAGVVALSWLGTKFIPVAAVLAAAGLIRLWREGRRPDAGKAAFVLVVFAAAYIAGHVHWYGALTVYATGQHFAETGQFSVVGVSPDYLSRGSRLIGLLIDGRFGLAAWQPAWLLLVPALAALSVRRPRNWGVLAAPLLVGWLTATFLALTMHGFWSPGRQVVVVLPLAVLVLAQWAGRSRKTLASLVTLGAAGVFNLGWLFWEGHTAGMTLAVHFQDTSSPLYRAASVLLPHYMQDTARTWSLHVLWVGAALIVAAMAAKNARHRHSASSTPA